MSRFVDLTLNGISSGMIYAAVAIAFVIIWRSTRVVNFAQGALFMVTTFIASSVIASSGSYWLGFVLALVAGLILGAVVERVLIRPVEGGPELNAVIVTIGLLIFLQAIAGMIWGGTPRSFPPAFSIRGFQVSGHNLYFAPFDLFTVGAVVVAALGLFLLFRHTDLGLRLRASAFAPTVARLVGGLVLGLSLSYVSGYAGSALVGLAALAILIAVLMVRPGGLFAAAHGRRI
jgi:branched-chain amino acid transport system permease protein